MLGGIDVEAPRLVRGDWGGPPSRFERLGGEWGPP
jgi:hypothetical protein